MKTKTEIARFFNITLAITLTLITCLFFPSCTPVQERDPKQELIKNYKPCKYEECLVRGQYGDYSYNIYSTSVEVLALSPDISVTYADVCDTDEDGRFDSVWIMEHGVWKFYSSKKHSVLMNTADQGALRDFTGLANLLKTKSEDRSGNKWGF